MNAEWWQKRALLRYRQLQKTKATIERIETALEGHADCWPDCPCLELAHDIRAALGGAA